MNRLKKSLPFLIAFGLMLPPKAAAEGLSYGVKVGLSTSFSRSLNDKQKIGLLTCVYRSLNDEQKKQFKQFKLVEQFKLDSSLLKLLEPLVRKLELDSRVWSPSFGAALYMEYALNDHIGLGAELFYNRFDQLFHMKLPEERDQVAQGLAQLKGTFSNDMPSNEIKTQLSFDTIGLPMLLTWYWTAAIRPDFKDDYFLGRLFMGVHPFYLVARTVKGSYSTGETHEEDLKFSKDEQRFKIGFIGGTSLELTNGLLLELKAMLPYNLMSEKDKEFRPNVTSFQLSLGCNFAKFM